MDIPGDFMENMIEEPAWGIVLGELDSQELGLKGLDIWEIYVSGGAFEPRTGVETTAHT